MAVCAMARIWQESMLNGRAMLNAASWDGGRNREVCVDQIEHVIGRLCQRSGFLSNSQEPQILPVPSRCSVDKARQTQKVAAGA
jgi:hypothetical protein